LTGKPSASPDDPDAAFAAALTELSSRTAPAKPDSDPLIDMQERGVPAGLPTPEECINQGIICLIAYARISDTRKKGDKKGVENQHATCRDIVRGHKHSKLLIVRRYTDNDLSAAKDDYRADFESMLADLNRGITETGHPVGGIICVDEDRIYRLPSQWERFVNAFRSRTARFYVDDAGTQDLYAEGAEIRGLMNVAISMGEIRKKKSRTRRWHAGQARRGIPHTGGRPFGWREGGMELEPEEAKVTKEAIKLCKAGAQWATIRNLYEKSGIPTRKGGPWRVQTVKQIVVSPRNAGLRTINGELYRDEDGSYKIGEWERLCEPADMEEVWERYKPRVRKPKSLLPTADDQKQRAAGQLHDKATKYLLSHRVRCGKVRDDTRRPCLTPMRGTVDSKGVAGYRYVCPPKSEGGCGGTGRHGPKLDDLIVSLVLARMKERAAVQHDSAPWDKENELSSKEAQLDTLNTRWLSPASEEERISDERYFKLSGLLEDQVRALRAEKKAWDLSNVSKRTKAADVERHWNYDLDLRQKRAVIAEMFQEIIVLPAGRGSTVFRPELIKVLWRED
jgi:DNA invertase Pin-like site-specific DNA recombinase